MDEKGKVLADPHATGIWSPKSFVCFKPVLNKSLGENEYNLDHVGQIARSQPPTK